MKEHVNDIKHDRSNIHDITQYIFRKDIEYCLDALNKLRTNIDNIVTYDLNIPEQLQDEILEEMPFPIGTVKPAVGTVEHNEMMKRAHEEQKQPPPYPAPPDH